MNDIIIVFLTVLFCTLMMLSIKIIYTISLIELGLQMDAFVFNSGILLREVQRRLRLISVCLVT